MEAAQRALEASGERWAWLEDYENEHQHLKEQREESRRILLEACGQLSAIRREAGEEYARRMSEELSALNFPAIGFELEWESGEELLTAGGYDRVSFLISLNPGEPMRPLEQIASGGELSRIMLALKTVFAGKDELYSFVFDEIDTGISGQTAWKVSGKMGRLAQDHQILCITHLPQIAAMQDSHYLIAKHTAGDRTVTNIRALSDEESDAELARLLGGETITEATLRNAREMKEMAAAAKREGAARA